VFCSRHGGVKCICNSLSDFGGPKLWQAPGTVINGCWGAAHLNGRCQLTALTACAFALPLSPPAAAAQNCPHFGTAGSALQPLLHLKSRDGRVLTEPLPTGLQRYASWGRCPSCRYAGGEIGQASGAGKEPAPPAATAGPKLLAWWPCGLGSAQARLRHSTMVRGDCQPCVLRSAGAAEPGSRGGSGSQQRADPPRGAGAECALGGKQCCWIVLHPT
jgi:hypothetical protein